MVEGILHAWHRIMRSSRGDTEARYGNPGTPRGSRSGWATRETPAGLPVTSSFSLAAADRHGLSAQRHTCQQECLQTEEQTVKFPAQSCFTVHIIWTSWWESLYLNCPCLLGTVVQKNLHPWWSAAPKAPLASQTPEGPAEPWTGCSGDAWLETNSKSSYVWLSTSEQR